jgi:hypothetical protein
VENFESNINISIGTERQPLADLPVRLGENKEAVELNSLPDRLTERIEDVKEYKLQECAEVAKSYFTPELIANWSRLGISDRQSIFEAYQHGIARELGVQDKGIVWYTPKDARILGYNNSDGRIYINRELLNDPTRVMRCIDTIAHESRHQFQADAISGRFGSAVDNSTKEEWRTAFSVYTSSDSSRYDPFGYYYNPLETDARHFGEGVAAAVNSKIYEGVHR